jgi:hypothetical protein
MKSFVLSVPIAMGPLSRRPDPTRPSTAVLATPGPHKPPENMLRLKQSRNTMVSKHVRRPCYAVVFEAQRLIRNRQTEDVLP